MPKDKKTKLNPHGRSVPLPQRQQVHTTEKEEVGELAFTANNIFGKVPAAPTPPTASKKEKQKLKHDALMRRLESARSPYSKSHSRRLKKKGKKELVTDMTDLQAAMDALSKPADTVIDGVVVHKPRPGQIGEGKATPLSRSQRKRALQVERLRHPLIMSNPSFATNPFETIRTHAKNTLVQYQRNA